MGWQIMQASDGVNYNWYKQDKDNSCACACWAMIARLLLNKMLGEATLRDWVRQAEGSKNTDKYGVRSFDSEGTGIDLHGSVANKLKLTSFTVKGFNNVAKWVQKCTPSRPCMLQVFWIQQMDAVLNTWDYAGGGHSVLAVKVHAGNLIVLDPGCGVVEIPVGDLPFYTANYGVNPSNGQMDYMAQISQ